jgi:hypothetical protein
MVKNRRGQSVLEYAVMLVVIIGALLAVQGYFKRGVMGKMRQGTDSIGAQFNPHTFASSVTTTRSGSRTEKTFPSGASETVFTDDREDRVGSEDVTGLLEFEQAFPQ